MAGVKETKEVAVAATAIAMEIVKLSKDGFKFSDILTLAQKVMSDPVLKPKFDAALADINQVPVELKDLTIPEALDVVMAVSSEVIAGLA